MGLYYEEFNVGDEWITQGRTITDADLMLFAGMSGDMHQLHTDEQWCKENTPFGGRIAHGLLTMSIGVGLSQRLGLTDGTAIANLGVSFKFVHPVRPGDTIRTVVRVKEKRLTSKPGRGIVTRTLTIKNQREETVAEGEITVMVRCRN